MGLLKVLLVLVEIISGVLLIMVILLQKSKDQGLGMAFGAGVGETLFGSRAGNVLTKITIGLGIVFMANTLFIGYLMSSGTTASGSLTDKLPAQTAVPVQEAPAGRVSLPSMPTPTTESLPAPVAAPNQDSAPAPGTTTP